MSLVTLGQAVAAKFAAEGGIRNQTRLRRAPADPLAPECRAARSPAAKWLSPIQRPSRGPQRPCGELRPSGPGASVNGFPSGAHAPLRDFPHGRFQKTAKVPLFLLLDARQH
jgi:hypothetical protein